MSSDCRRGDHLSTVRARVTEQFIQVFALLVFLQGSFLFEGFPTLGAKVLLLISKLTVDEIQMAQQVGLLGESLAALCAQIRFLPRVDSFVGGKIGVCFEPHATQGALKR